jgi:hypothetical protein
LDDSELQHYRDRHPLVKAFRFTGEPVGGYARRPVGKDDVGADRYNLEVQTPFGLLHVAEGDWVVSIPGIGLVAMSDHTFRAKYASGPGEHPRRVAALESEVSALLARLGELEPSDPPLEAGQARDYTAERLREIVATEGLAYAVTEFVNPLRIRDDAIRRQWRIADAALSKLADMIGPVEAVEESEEF